MLRHFCVVAVACACACGGGGKQTSSSPPSPAPSAPPDPWAGVHAVAESEVSHHALVGLAVGVAYKGNVVFAKGYGFEDREAKVKVDPKTTLFRWASCGKTVTSVIAASLAREGVINFDANVTTYYPAFAPVSFLEKCTEPTHAPANSRGGPSVPCTDGLADVPLKPEERTGVTIRRLLGHLGGVPHYENGRGTPNPPKEVISDPKRNTGIEWAMDFVRDKPLIAPPGVRFAYSSFGFNLLGVALEKASHQRFDDLVESRINQKIGTHIVLDHETAPTAKTITNAHRAVGYTMHEGVVAREKTSTDVAWKAPAGGIVSSVTDFTRFCAALDGESLLTAAEKEVLWTSMKDGAGKPTEYGMGFEVDRYLGQRHISHDGAQEKTRTMLSYYPERHVCIVVMTNAEYGDVYSISPALDRAALAAIN